MAKDFSFKRGHLTKKNSYEESVEFFSLMVLRINLCYYLHHQNCDVNHCINQKTIGQ